MSDIKLAQAILFANKKHQNDPVKVMRSLKIMEILIDAKLENIDSLCIAILHDIIETTDTTFREIATDFGDHVASIIAQLTTNKSDEIKSLEFQLTNLHNLSFEASIIKMAVIIYKTEELLQKPVDDEQYQLYCIMSEIFYKIQHIWDDKATFRSTLMQNLIQRFKQIQTN